MAGGLLTHRQLYGPAWLRVFRDVHVASDVELTQAVRARFDFAWEHLRFAVEYDGSTHVASSTRPEAPFRLPRDRRKLNEARELGWRVFYVTAPDGHDMAGLVTRISAALHARAADSGVPLHQ